MPNITNWKQANSNLAHTQGGSQGASEDAFVTGASAGKALRFVWDNVRGSLGLGSSAHIAYFDHFLGNVGATDTPAPWSADAGSTGTALPEGTAGDAAGTLELTTAAAAANDFVTLALGTHWVVGAGESGHIFFEASVQVDQLTETVLEVGLSDALSETAGLAFSDHDVATVTDVATNALVFAFDSAVGTNWLVNTSNAGTPQAVNTGIAIVAETWYALRIEIAPNGKAVFYINGTQVAEVTDAVADEAALTPWITLLTLGTDASVASVDYVGIVGDNGVYAE